MDNEGHELDDQDEDKWAAKADEFMIVDIHVNGENYII